MTFTDFLIGYLLFGLIFAAREGIKIFSIRNDLGTVFNGSNSAYKALTIVVLLCFHVIAWPYVLYSDFRS